jgi:AmmeMemoRadiSam system protein A
MARAAAFDDPRFPALEETDLDNVDVEISVLTPPRPISSPDEIEVGVHGLIVEMGYNKGLLLPQVAVEWKWDSREFLEQTCLKAGLDASSWQDPDASIYVFSAEVFGEREG